MRMTAAPEGGRFTPASQNAVGISRLYSTRPIAAVMNPDRSLKPAVYAWILIILAQAQFRKRSVTELTQGAGFDSQVIFQIIAWFVLALIAVVLIRRKQVDWDLLRFGPLKWYTAFMLVALGSTSYSAAPALSAFRVVQHLIALVLVASMGRNLKRLHIFAMIFVGATAILIVLGAVGITFGLSWITPPSESSLWTAEPEWRFASAFGHPTTLATVAAVAIFAADDARRSMARVAVIIFNLTALGLTVSRTAIGGLIVGFTIMMAAKRRLILFACLCGALTVSVFLIPAWSGTLTSYLTRDQSTDQLTSLNGRVALYEDAWRRIQEHWLLGQGFMSNRVAILDEQADGSGTLHAHNVLLEALTGTGIIGGFLALAACIHLCILPLVILRRSDGRPPLRREAIVLASSLPPVIGACLLDAGFATTLTMLGWAFMVLAARGQEAVNACTVTQKSESYRYIVLPK